MTNSNPENCGNQSPKFRAGRTVVLQSHGNIDARPWINDCTKSVKNWAAQQGYEYRFKHDEFFDYIDRDLFNKISEQKVVASDLARLLWIQDSLRENHIVRAIWLDSDMLVAAPDEFNPESVSYAVGREVWIQPDRNARPKAYVKVHNAFLMFERENPFLDFYIHSATKLLRQHNGPMVPQLIGPKLLTALHNMVRLNVCEQAGMISPAVAHNILTGKGPYLTMFKVKSPQPPAAVNLSSSMQGVPQQSLPPLYVNHFSDLCRTLVNHPERIGLPVAKQKERPVLL